MCGGKDLFPWIIVGQWTHDRVTDWFGQVDTGTDGETKILYSGTLVTPTLSLLSSIP